MRFDQRNQAFLGWYVDTPRPNVGDWRWFPYNDAPELPNWLQTMGSRRLRCILTGHAEAANGALIKWGPRDNRRREVKPSRTALTLPLNNPQSWLCHDTYS